MWYLPPDDGDSLVTSEGFLMESTVKTSEAFEQYLAEMRQILQAALAEVPCRVYLFGSRAIGTAHPGSEKVSYPDTIAFSHFTNGRTAMRIECIEREERFQ